MTLNLGIVAPWGCWLCTDYRLTRHDGSLYDDYSPKYLSVHCPDGTMLITYTGLGVTDRAGRVHTSAWLRDVLVGQNVSLDQSLTIIRERATAELTRYGQTLIFAVAATFKNGNRWVAQIANVRRTGATGLQRVRTFETVASEITDKPFIICTGSGSEALSQDDRKLLTAIAYKEPRKPESYLKLLAQVNRRTATTRAIKRADVSHWCYAEYMPPDGTALRGRTFYLPQSAPPATLGVRIILFGIDMTESSQLMARKRAGQGGDESEYANQLEEAVHRSVEKRR